MKFTISMNDELFKKLDEYANNNYLNRSSLISISVNNYLQDVEIKKKGGTGGTPPVLAL